MRKKMEDHQKRQDCVQCHRLMDPIGFSLENFDGVALWRETDEGQPVDAAAKTFDDTSINGPAELRKWLVGRYSHQFVTVTAEKLLVYALGRGVEHQDMPLVREMARQAEKNGNRFSSLVLAVVQSKPFQMNSKTQPSSSNVPKAAAAGFTTNDKGNH